MLAGWKGPYKGLGERGQKVTFLIGRDVFQGGRGKKPFSRSCLRSEKTRLPCEVSEIIESGKGGDQGLNYLPSWGRRGLEHQLVEGRREGSQRVKKVEPVSEREKEGQGERTKRG